MRTEYVGRRLTRGEAHVPHQCHQRICMGIACRQRRSSSPRPSDLAPGRCNREAGGGRAADRAAAAGWQRQGGSGRAAAAGRQRQGGHVCVLQAIPARQRRQARSRLRHGSQSGTAVQSATRAESSASAATWTTECPLLHICAN